MLGPKEGSSRKDSIFGRSSSLTIFLLPGLCAENTIQSHTAGHMETSPLARRVLGDLAMDDEDTVKESYARCNK